MPLFSSSSPFDQDVGKLCRSLVASFLNNSIDDQLGRFIHRKSDEWT